MIDGSRDFMVPWLVGVVLGPRTWIWPVIAVDDETHVGIDRHGIHLTWRPKLWTTTVHFLSLPDLHPDPEPEQ